MSTVSDPAARRPDHAHHDNEKHQYDKESATDSASAFSASARVANGLPRSAILAPGRLEDGIDPGT